MGGKMSKLANVVVVMGLVCLLVIGVISGCGKEKAKTMDIPTVKTQTITMGRAGSGAAYAGEVKGRYESQLAFQVGGRIASRNVELGSKVKAGDILLQLDPKDVTENVNIGAAQVAAAKAQLDLAATNMERYRQLYEQEAVSAAQYDQYKTNYDAALASYKQAEAQYAQSGNALGYTKLTADGDGVISAINAETGQVVAAGQSVVTLVKTDDLEVEINIPENRLSQATIGMPVQVALWALEGVNVKGTIREVSPMADPVARTYKVRISLLEPPPTLRLGMTASVADFGMTTGETAILIPLTAVYQTGNKPQVWLVREDAVYLQDIVIDKFSDNQVKVTNGLKDGDVIVTAGVHKLHEGQQVHQMESDLK